LHINKHNCPKSDEGHLINRNKMSCDNCKQKFVREDFWDMAWDKAEEILNTLKEDGILTESAYKFIRKEYAEQRQL